MKTKLILAILVSVILSLNTMAQEKRTRGNRESIIDHKTELVLSDVQVKEIETVQKEYMPKIKEARKSENKEALKKLNEERKVKIEQVLTPEQLAKWKAIVEKKKADRQNPELKTELKTYRKQNIQPVIIEKRKAFETELSAEDKLVIADLRAKREAFVKSGKGMNKEERMMRGKELKMEAHKTLKPIIEKHKPSLEKINSELEASKIQWKTDMDAIKAKHKTDYKPRHEGKSKGKHEMHRAIQFLLMNTEKK